MTEQEAERQEKLISFERWKREHIFRHGQRGYYSLAELPQRPGLGQSAFGVGWWEMDEIFKFYPGQFVVVSGLAGSGKSTLFLNILCNVARQFGKRWFCYVPENEAFLSEKLRGIWKEDETFDAFCRQQCFVQSSFVDTYDGEPKTLNWVLDNAIIAIERDGVSIVLIDPWNELEHACPRGMLMTDYIRECLRLLKQFCRLYNVTVVVVAHPTKAVNESGGRTPRLSDIEGSMAWFNKCDNGLIVVRDGGTRVISAKVREVGAGRLGACHFQVDAQSGIFTPEYGAVT